MSTGQNINFTFDEIWAGLTSVDGRKLESDDVSSALVEIDQASILKEEDAQLVSVLWDKKADINGRNAEFVISAQPLAKSNATYCISTAGGRTLVMQPFNPKTQGFQPMTEAEALALGEEHRARLVRDRALGRIKKTILESLNSD